MKFGHQETLVTMLLANNNSMQHKLRCKHEIWSSGNITPSCDFVFISFYACPLLIHYKALLCSKTVCSKAATLLKDTLTHAVFLAGIPGNNLVTCLIK